MVRNGTVKLSYGTEIFINKIDMATPNEIQRKIQIKRMEMASTCTRQSN
jgi:hypothetical protein